MMKPVAENNAKQSCIGRTIVEKYKVSRMVKYVRTFYEKIYDGKLDAVLIST